MQAVSTHTPFGCFSPSEKAVLNWRTIPRWVDSNQCDVFGSSIRPSKALKIPCRRARKWACRAEFSQDAPFVVAIGACVLSSLVLTKRDDKKTDAALGGDDVRNGAMTIISFIPIFNWLGWVFAWLDTKEQRFLFYACVYLTPYVRTGFDLTSDDSWLLILSYMACLAHVQLEANLQNGGIEFGKTLPQDSLWQQSQKKERSELRGNESRNFQESLSPDDDDDDKNAHPPAEEDLSQIELSEFDKKLLGKKRMEEDVKSAGDAAREKQSAENADQ